MKASDFIKRFEEKQKEDAQEEPEKDHSLQAQAKEHAQHPKDMNAGTAHDWEDMDKWQEELDRLDREGPGKRS